MKTTSDEEKEDADQINREIEKFKTILRQIPPESKAYFIMKSFFGLKDPSEHLRNQFHEWLLSPDNAEAKNNAMERCFDEIMDETEKEAAVVS